VVVLLGCFSAHAPTETQPPDSSRTGRLQLAQSHCGLWRAACALIAIIPVRPAKWPLFPPRRSDQARGSALAVNRYSSLLPVSIICMASSRRDQRGSRAVPPRPGCRPEQDFRQAENLGAGYRRRNPHTVPAPGRRPQWRCNHGSAWLGRAGRPLLNQNMRVRLPEALLIIASFCAGGSADIRTGRKAARFWPNGSPGRGANIRPARLSITSPSFAQQTFLRTTHCAGRPCPAAPRATSPSVARQAASGSSAV